MSKPKDEHATLGKVAEVEFFEGRNDYHLVWKLIVNQERGHPGEERELCDYLEFHIVMVPH
jgi:hypothetical protein